MRHTTVYAIHKLMDDLDEALVKEEAFLTDSAEEDFDVAKHALGLAELACRGVDLVLTRELSPCTEIPAGVLVVNIGDDEGTADENQESADAGDSNGTNAGNCHNSENDADKNDNAGKTEYQELDQGVGDADASEEKDKKENEKVAEKEEVDENQENMEKEEEEVNKQKEMKEDDEENATLMMRMLQEETKKRDLIMQLARRFDELQQSYRSM